MPDKRDNERKQVAEWLNTKGLDIEFDADGFWMEDYRFQDHKTKDVADLMREYSQSVSEQNVALRAAISEMARMLPVLEAVERRHPGALSEYTPDGTLANVSAYRQALETALAKIEESK